MHVVIFGATGFVGRAILKATLAQNHDVTILVRNRESVLLEHENLTIVEGNVLSRKAVWAILKKKDIVIQCLGVGGKGDGKPTNFVSYATEIIIEGMERNNISKIIAMSNFGAGNSFKYQPWYFNKIILPYFMKWLKVIIDDKNRMETIIMNSKVDWIILRSPKILDIPAIGYWKLSLEGKEMKSFITLGDLASLVVFLIIDKTYSRQAASISN
jgi:putative NADH-flavin reductase